MRKLYLSILLLSAGVTSLFSQEIEQAVRERLQTFFQAYAPADVNIGTCRLDSVRVDFRRKTISIYADVTLVSKEGNKVQFLIDGKPYDVDIVMAENGSCSILHDGNSFNAELIRGEGGKSYDVNMFYRSYHVDIVDTQTKYLRMKKGGEEKQDDRIIAPMPGKVVKIPVQKGDRLSAGDIVVVLEAMKMQSNYKVSSDCVVKDILVQEGDAVNANQELIILDIIKED